MGLLPHLPVDDPFWATPGLTHILDLTLDSLRYVNYLASLREGQFARGWGGRAAAGRSNPTQGLQKIFFINPNLLTLIIPVISPCMKSFHYEPREIKATEARLRSIYDAAYLGLKGDSLALAAGLMPVEYRQLCQLDPVAELAEKQGRADSEITASRALHNAAQQGDARAALAILQHRHEWSAKQEISVDIYQKISITQALADATNRVIEHMPMKELNGPTADL